ncbi:cold-shock protein [Nocardia brasiliensis]|uniref:cold-shock protein n=1 Tax=Nocardia brasiliensis TaxID=37326 RepID=UPI0018940BCD|nr:cold shock domain-containing protein [Nocardia brasiliensis]MBF6542281.1 cold shock domain-containing protein [Nocardia brasiliensis]
MTTTASPIDTHPDAAASRWHRGRVSWFDSAKGFGFLTAPTGAAVFVDHSVIDMPGYKTLTAGQRVEYTASDTGRGLEATRVVPVPCSTERSLQHRDRLPIGRSRSTCLARAS